MRCAKCGNVLENGAMFCGKCGEIVRKSEARRPTPPVDVGRAISSVNRMPQGIAMGVGEQIVKKYTIGRYTLRQGAIDVIVTNKRVIRYEESRWMGMQNNRIDEINIDAVHGMSTSMVRSISIMGLIAALALVGCGIGLLTATSGGRYYGYGSSSSSSMLIFGIIAIAIGVFVFIKSCRPTLVFSMLGAVGGPALTTQVNMRGRIFGRNDTSLVFQFKPTPETTVMLKELGACVYDLKTLGDSAIAKWR